MPANGKKINHAPEKNQHDKAGSGRLARGCSDRTRAIGFVVKESRFRLNIRKTFFAVRW